MTIQLINIGTDPNDGNGSTLRGAATIINENFEELYTIVGAGGEEYTVVNSITGGTGISVNSSTGNIVVTNTAPNIRAFTKVAVSGQTTLLAGNTVDTINLASSGIVALTTTPGSSTVTISATQLPADWDAVSGPTSIINKPAFPDAQIQSDWNQTDVESLDYINNKPTIPVDISELSDDQGILNVDEYKNTVQRTTVNPSTTSVVFTASVNNVTGFKVVIQASGIGGVPGVDQESQICEMLVLRNFPITGAPVIDSVVYSIVYTGVSPMITFDAQWNPTSEKIEITGTNLSAVSGDILGVKLLVTELIG